MTFSTHLQAGHLAFKCDPLDEELANQCANDIWSACDWVFKEHGSSLSMRDLRDMQTQMVQRVQVIALFQDAANGTKHKAVRMYTPELEEAKSHQGAFDPGFSSGFDISALFLVRQDQWRIPLGEAQTDIIHGWEKFFADSSL